MPNNSSVLSGIDITIREAESEAAAKAGMAYHKGFTDDKKLKDFNLQPKQKFIYLYDFGDNLDFSIEVYDIEETDKLLIKPKVIEKKGTPPDQYDIRG